MLLKLITLLALAHHLSACCLPDTFQVTILSESRYSGRGEPVRARIVMAADAASGRSAVLTSAPGYESAMYVDTRARRAFYYSPPYGCHQSSVDDRILQQLNRSRCVPDETRPNTSVVPIELPKGERARLISTVEPEPEGYGGSGRNVSMDALVTERCQIVMKKVRRDGSDNTMLFGDFKTRPESYVLDLPVACRNATRAGMGSRKRHAMHLAYVARSLYFI